MLHTPSGLMEGEQERDGGWYMMLVEFSPVRLKYAEVVQLYKKGDKKDMSNYRPVSLLTAFSKVFEKVIYVGLYQHLISHDVLVNEQFGFKAKSYTAKATFNLINEILKALNSKKVVGAFSANWKKLLIVLIMIYYYVNSMSRA